MDLLKKIFGGSVAATVETVGNVIDQIDKSDEKLALQLQYKQMLLDIQSKAMDYESKLLDNQTAILQTELKGESWLQRNWRPLLMVVCIFIIFNNYVLVPYFGIPSAVLDKNIWDVFTLGIGGYIGGRSLEKIADKVSESGLLQSKPKRVRHERN